MWSYANWLTRHGVRPVHRGVTQRASRDTSTAWKIKRGHHHTTPATATPPTRHCHWQTSSVEVLLQAWRHCDMRLDMVLSVATHPRSEMKHEIESCQQVVQAAAVVESLKPGHITSPHNALALAARCLKENSERVM